MRTTASGADSSVPLMMDRARGEELELVASAASYAVAPTTRTGARNGTATSNFAESSLQFVAPSVMVARPRSMASLSTISKWKNSLSVNENPTASTVAQASRTSKGSSTRCTATKRDKMRHAEATPTQIGQLIPGHAE